MGALSGVGDMLRCVPGSTFSAVWAAILSAHLVFASDSANEEKELEAWVDKERAEACAHPSRFEQCQYLSSFREGSLPSLLGHDDFSITISAGRSAEVKARSSHR